MFTIFILLTLCLILTLANHTPYNNTTLLKYSILKFLGVKKQYLPNKENTHSPLFPISRGKPEGKE